MHYTPAPFNPPCMPPPEVLRVLGWLTGVYEYACPKCGRVGQFTAEPTVDRDGQVTHCVAAMWSA